MKNLNRRTVVTGITTAVCAHSSLFASKANAESHSFKRSLIDAQSGLIGSLGLQKLADRAALAPDLPTGLTSSLVRDVDQQMSTYFPDDSQSSVFGADQHSVFFRYSDDGLNFCCAWFLGNSTVTMMEGPILVTLYAMGLQVGSFLEGRENPNVLTRRLLAPVVAGDRYQGSFQSVDMAPHRFTSELALVAVKYSRDKVDQRKGHAHFELASRETGDPLLSGSASISLI